MQPVAPTLPTNISPPVLAGRTTVGGTLRSSTGAWSGDGAISYTYGWTRCFSTCSVITDAAGGSYTLSSADVGARIAVLVTATNSGGSASASTAQLGPVASSRPTTGQLKAALAKTLKVSGRPAKIGTLLKHHGYTTLLVAPSAGKLTISWSCLVKPAHRAERKVEVLVASARATFHGAGRLKVKIMLTGKGQHILMGAKRLKLTMVGRFSRAGDPPVNASKTITLHR